MRVSGRVLLLAFLIPVVSYLTARILDPVRTRRWEARVWWRFPPGTVVPESMDSDLLARSPSRRIWDRVQAAVLLAVLLGILAALGILRLH